jgi:hypothetical protein
VLHWQHSPCLFESKRGNRELIDDSAILAFLRETQRFFVENVSSDLSLLSQCSGVAKLCIEIGLGHDHHCHWHDNY